MRHRCCLCFGRGKPAVVTPEGEVGGPKNRSLIFDFNVCVSAENHKQNTTVVAPLLLHASRPNVWVGLAGPKSTKVLAQHTPTGA